MSEWYVNYEFNIVVYIIDYNIKFKVYISLTHIVTYQYLVYIIVVILSTQVI